MAISSHRALLRTLDFTLGETKSWRVLSSNIIRVGFPQAAELTTDSREAAVEAVTREQAPSVIHMRNEGAQWRVTIVRILVYTGIPGIF